MKKSQSPRTVREPLKVLDGADREIVFFINPNAQGMTKQSFPFLPSNM
jgi:hypothetical protein